MTRKTGTRGKASEQPAIEDLVGPGGQEFAKRKNEAWLQYVAIEGGAFGDIQRRRHDHYEICISTRREAISGTRLRGAVEQYIRAQQEGFEVYAEIEARDWAEYEKALAIASESAQLSRDELAQEIAQLQRELTAVDGKIEALLVGIESGQEIGQRLRQREAERGIIKGRLVRLQSDLLSRGDLVERIDREIAIIESELAGVDQQISRLSSAIARGHLASVEPLLNARNAERARLLERLRVLEGERDRAT